MRIRSLPVIAAVCGTFVCVASAADAAITVLGDSQAHNCFEAAEFGGKVEEGIATCDGALNGAPMSVSDRAATLINRGILKSRANDSQGALADYNSGLALDANLGEGYVDRGATYIVLNNFDAALQDIDKGIAMGANKLEIAYYDRAIVDEARGDIRAAYEDYRKAITLQPDFPLAQDALSRFKVVRHQPPSGT